MNKDDIEKAVIKIQAELYKGGVSLEFSRQVIMNVLIHNLIARCETLKEVHSYLDDLSTEGKKGATSAWPFKFKILEKFKLDNIN